MKAKIYRSCTYRRSSGNIPRGECIQDLSGSRQSERDRTHLSQEARTGKDQEIVFSKLLCYKRRAENNR